MPTRACVPACHHPGMGTDDLQDPLERLAAELERLSEATLALGAATERLAHGAGDDAPALEEAAAASRRAARTAAAASARVGV